MLIHVFEQHKAILQRKLPDNLKLSIAKTIENNLFAKVLIPISTVRSCCECYVTCLQVPFLSGMHGVGEIRTLFAAEVRTHILVHSGSLLIMSKL
jgi:hypothetical protein